jgi:hypothetical protein
VQFPNSFRFSPDEWPRKTSFCQLSLYSFLTPRSMPINVVQSAEYWVLR